MGEMTDDLLDEEARMEASTVGWSCEHDWEPGRVRIEWRCEACHVPKADESSVDALRGAMLELAIGRRFLPRWVPLDEVLSVIDDWEDR